MSIEFTDRYKITGAPTLAKQNHKGEIQIRVFPVYNLSRSNELPFNKPPGNNRTRDSSKKNIRGPLCRWGCSKQFVFDWRGTFYTINTIAWKAFDYLGVAEGVEGLAEVNEYRTCLLIFLHVLPDRIHEQCCCYLGVPFPSKTRLKIWKTVVIFKVICHLFAKALFENFWACW